MILCPLEITGPPEQNFVEIVAHLIGIGEMELINGAPGMLMLWAKERLDLRVPGFRARANSHRRPQEDSLELKVRPLQVLPKAGPREAREYVLHVVNLDTLLPIVLTFPLKAEVKVRELRVSFRVTISNAGSGDILVNGVTG